MSAGTAALAARVGWGVVGREYLLAGHLIDRAGMPNLIATGGKDLMTEVAIDEWRGASPVYTERTRELLGITDTDVTALFKAMQFDIGAPHGFLDFRFTVHDAEHGEFTLAHCGALADVEPMGEEFVWAMCHAIEDPTFDATAVATNPRARVRPIHRPPRTPVDRMPHCRWTVTIDSSAEPLGRPDPAVAVGTTVLGKWPVPSRAPSGSGAVHYDDALDPDLVLERFADSTVESLCEEFALQGHLLGIAFGLALQARGVDPALHVAEQLVGAAGVAARRLGRLLARPDSAPARLARVEMLAAAHPLFGVPGYLDLAVASDGTTSRWTLAGAAFTEDAPGWGQVLQDGEVLVRVAQVALRELDPAAEVAREGEALVVRIGTSDTPRAQDPAVEMAAFSTGVEFALPFPRHASRGEA